MAIGAIIVLLFRVNVGNIKVEKITPIASTKQKPFNLRAIYPSSLIDKLCYDANFLNQIHIDQWYQAVDEIFGANNAATIGVNDKDMGFYKETYGALNLHLPKQTTNPLGFDSIIYYRIYKNGNDNIRSLIYEFAHILTGEHQSFIENNCPSDQCSHKYIQLLYNPQLRMMNSTAKRFAFTFVREPITRFVSAMNEIESRAYLDKSKTEHLNLLQPLGTHHRFMEFVNKVLLSGASQFIFRDNEQVEMGHIAPMIGTLLMAHSVNTTPIKLYHFEDFKAGWHQLCEDTKLHQLEDVFLRRKKPIDWVQHASSRDPVNATKASLQFLSLAGGDAMRRQASSDEYVPRFM